MKLRDLMRDYLEIQDNTPSHLKMISENIRSLDTPCSVGGKETWLDSESEYSKEFSFSSREPLRSFCSYILDLEGQSTVNFCLNINSGNNSASLKIPKGVLSKEQFRSLTNEVDNIHYDVSESFKK